MADLTSLFAGTNFRATVTRYCEQHEWRLADLNDDYACLRFDMESGRTQTLHIIRFDTTLEFSVPSFAAFDSQDEVPHFISTLLMKSNRENKVGFWCIDVIGSRHVYSYMHNAEITLLNTDYFARVVRACIRECDKFETMLDKMLSH